MNETVFLLFRTVPAIPASICSVNATDTESSVTATELFTSANFKRIKCMERESTCIQAVRIVGFTKEVSLTGRSTAKVLAALNILYIL